MSSLCFFIWTRKKGKLSFLDEEVSRQESKFVTKFYRKPTFSGAYTHFDSFLPTVFKFDMVFTLACQSFNFSSHWTKFLEELNFLKGVFFNNEYFLSFIDKCFKTVIKKLVLKRPQITAVEKKTLIPYCYT